MNMDNNMVENNASSENTLNTLQDFFLKLIGLTQEAYHTIIDSAFYDNASTVLSEICDDAEDISKLYKGIKLVASIPDRLFLNKFEKLVLGVCEISESKRQKYVEKITKEKFNKETVFIFDVVSKSEELGKIDIFVKLWEAKMDGIIDDALFKRYILMTANTMQHDLEYMRDNICTGFVHIDSIEKEALIAQGWMIISGLDGGEIDDEGENTSSGAVYSYTNNAVNYCKCIWNITVDSVGDVNAEDIFTGKALSEEDINCIFDSAN